MEYPEILLQFGMWQSHLNRSKKTIEEYRLNLVLFFKFLIARKNNLPTTGEEFDKIDVSKVDANFVAKVTTEQIYDFLTYINFDRANKPATRARKLSAIKTFYKYLTNVLRIIDENPAANIDAPNVKTSLPKFLTLDESINLLDTVAGDEESKTKERDYAIVTLFLNCGMRLSELVGLNLNDIDPHLTTVRVLGKGSKERMLYLNDACREALKRYLAVRNSKEGIKDKNALFLSGRGKRISNKTVQWLIYKYLDKAGLGYKHLSTHKLRHTAATLMYQSGNVDVRVLKDVLGHEQLNTTQIYTHVSDKQMKEAMNQNPLAKKKP